MIPILYEKDEIAFISNGLGRLRDCISAVVVEERNSIYELDFEYPVNGTNYDRIQVGRIVGVTHDESDDIQPFDIVSFTRPINGVVTFHCVHISYRQSYLTVTGSNINSLSAAFTLLSNSTPTNPFTYQTDKTSTGYLASADGIPKTVRSMLGGVEGSILDAYGGEYEWDRWNVILHSARGEARNFSIRYGVNMLDYNEDYDSQGTYSSCIPYWTDGATTIVGDKQTSDNTTVTGRDECIPLDVSEKFESQPTKAQVNSMGLSVMNSRNSTLPSQNIHIEFVRLQDMGYEDLDNLLDCKLCDTIKVVFPYYNTTGRFKIVKTVWNVLKDRYDSMELGDLSVSLAEALGITGSTDVSSALEKLYGGTLALNEMIPANSNLNNYKSLGRYAVESAAVSATITNTPNTAHGYVLEVKEGQSSNTIMQIAYQLSGVRNYVRYYTVSTNTWTAWSKYYNGIATVFDHTKFGYSSGFTYYATSGGDQPMAVRRGTTVMLKGAFKTTAAQSSAGIKTIGTVPSGCEPVYEFRARCQGSNLNTYLLKILANGTMQVERYGTTTDTAMPNGAWLNISCTYICKEY